MINIKKSLASHHITLRWFGPLRYHNICGHGYCREATCKNCPHTKYYVRFGNSTREYRLPNWIQRKLRKRWD